MIQVYKVKITAAPSLFIFYRARYFEHTQNLTFLRVSAYPFVREVAMFYASYLKLDPISGRYEVPHACAQVQ